MKKVLALLMAMCTAMCAFADDLTFNVAVEGNVVTVMPSVDDQLYFCAAIDEATIEFFAEATQGQDLDLTSPWNLFIIASGLYKENLFTGISNLVCLEGNNTLVMCAAEQTEERPISPIGEITIMPITIEGGNDNPDPEPLTFTFEGNNEGITITPSDNEQEYIVYVAPQELIEATLGMYNLTIESYVSMMASHGYFFGHVFTGVTYHPLEEFASEEEDLIDGTYTAILAGVKDQGTYHDLTSPIYQFEWVVDRNTTGIRNIEAATLASKLFKEGKFIINGRVNLDGSLVR